VDALRQRVEVEPVADGRDDLAVHDAALRQLGQHRRDDVGEVAGQGLGGPARDLHLVAVAKDDGTEPVPLRLEQVAAVDRVGGGHPLDRLGEHGLQRRHDGQVHRTRLRCPGPPAGRRSLD
jgi:hypothetical protein